MKIIKCKSKIFLNHTAENGIPNQVHPFLPFEIPCEYLPPG